MKSDKRIDNWFLGKGKSIKAKNQMGGSNLSFKKGTGVTNLISAARKQPEVMVKIPARTAKTNGMGAIKNHIDYISRNGKVDIENQDGEIITGKPNIKENVINEWKLQGIPEISKYRESLNVVLSMPAGTPPDAVHRAAREFAKEVFKDHQYVMALHTDEPHPHVHLCVMIRDLNGKRMNPRKNDLFQWRVKFAEKMREQGIDCAATKRQHRGQTQKGENSIITSIKKRGGKSTIEEKIITDLAEAMKQEKKPDNDFIKRQLDTRNLVIDQYKEISKLLYISGYKKEANLISKLSKDVEQASTNTRIQSRYESMLEQDQEIDR